MVALTGDMGSGKTVFVQGICAGLKVEEMVTSPSFTLIHEYHGVFPVYHFDFYRLNSTEEIESLDLEYYYQLRGICLIEWAERGDGLLPEARLSVTLIRSLKDENLRNIRIVDSREAHS